MYYSSARGLGGKDLRLVIISWCRSLFYLFAQKRFIQAPPADSGLAITTSALWSVVV